MLAMVFEIPHLDGADLCVLAEIERMRDDLSGRVAEPRRWVGGLRRLTFARAVQGSNSIEGYNATLDDVVAAVDGDDELLDAETETKLAVTGYRDAMTYVLQLAQDDAARVDEGLLKALHFMMLRHDLSKYPGRWRPGSIFVRREPEGTIVYEGPDPELVPDLISGMLQQLDRSEDTPVLVRAAMAHLNLVMIHPFKDGNGRMARCLQTLVLAKEKMIAPVFSSIEEYLGRNTQAYYDVLADVGKGAWNPHHDSKSWIRFTMTAHYRQAQTLLRRFDEYERLWLECARLANERGVHTRSIGALMDAALSLRLRNASYRSTVANSEGDEISELTATRDLKLLVDVGLLDAVGERRGRYYVGSFDLKETWRGIGNTRPPRDLDDPYVMLRQADELDAAARARAQSSA